MVFYCLLDMSSSSLNNENNDYDLYTIVPNDEKIDFINGENINKQSKTLLLSSIETDDEGEFFYYYN